MAPTPSDVLPTCRHRRQWSEAHARHILHQLAKSKEGIAAFCRRYGICRQRLWYWKRQLRNRESEDHVSSFVEVLPPANSPSQVLAMNANPAFAPSALTLTLSGGASIAVTHGTDLMLLRRVLEALS